MVKILGFNGKIIIAILYVYYCEINAETEISDLRKHSNSEHGGGRRGNAKKKSASESKHDHGQLRTSKATDKYTRGVRADIQMSVPKHYPRHGPPEIEPVLRNDEDTSSDSDSEKDNISDRQNNYVVDWKQNADRDPDKNYKTSREHKMDKNHNTNRNPKPNKEKNHSIDKRQDNRNRNPTTAKDIGKSHNRNSATKDHNVDSYYNMKRDHHMDIYKDKDKNHMKDKSHNKDTLHYTDRTPDHDFYNKMEDSHYHDYTSKKYPKKERRRDKSYGKDIKVGGPIKIPKLHPEPLQGRILALEKTTKKMSTHHKHSKLRTHKQTDEAEHIQSTRMTPMYLMNQQGETEGDQNQKLDNIAQHVDEALSPYALRDQMTRFLQQFSEANATIETIGRTVEYNDIIIVKITEKKRDTGKYFRAEESKYIDDVPEKKIILIVHGLSVMGMNQLQCLNSAYGFKTLLSYYLDHLQKFDIYLIPMANPDGYSAGHSLTGWNKNVSPQDACAGVALDRNFDVAWNVTRQISSCSQLYPGSAPFSEIETKAVRDVFHYHGHKILAYIHVHAGTYTPKVFKGDAILYPRGFTDLQTDDDKYIDLKGEIDEAMKNASFQVMSVAVDTLFNWYGRVTGTSVDYASSVYGIPYALEFVMQLYEGEPDDWGYEHYALTDIWGRLIETTFNNMWKSMHTNELRRK